ncbi:MAG: hypothetical protein AAFY46_17135, partial [Planctomycetota bacterium]
RIDLGTITTTANATARPIALSPEATAAGWSITATDIAANPIAAQGPFAFGWVGILTIDPFANEDGGDNSEPVALRALLNTMSDEATDDLAANLEGVVDNWYSPYAGRSTDQLLYRYIDAVASSQPPGSGGFILIAAVPLALALLLGPIDYITLGAFRRRPLAWLSALVWIAAVGSIALVAPRLFQTGDADVGSVAATDLILPNLALPLASTENAAAGLPAHLAGWSAEAALLFHASQTPFQLESTTPAAWRPFESGRSSSAALAGMTFRQRPTGPGPDAHASIEPLRIPSRIWSLATLHAEGPTPPTFAIALGTLDNQLTAQLTGLPENARVLAAHVLR